MKKSVKFFCMAIVALMTVVALSVVAFAEEESGNILVVNGVSVGSEHSSGTGWSYDHTSRVLTLDNYDGGSIEMYYGRLQADSYTFDGTGSFTLKLVGENHIICPEEKSIALNFSRVETAYIEGDGALLVDSMEGQKNCGIGGMFTNLTVKGGDITVSNKFDFCFYSDKVITFAGGVARIKGGDSALGESAKRSVWGCQGIIFGNGASVDNAKYIKNETEGTQDDCDTLLRLDTSSSLIIRVEPEEPAETTGSTESTESKAISVLDNPETKWTSESKNGMTFRFDMDIANFSKLVIDGKEVDKKDYTIKAGSVIVELSYNYMISMANGNHTLQVYDVENNVGSVEFTVSGNAVSPKTGVSGNPTLWISLIAVSSLGICSVIYVSKKAKAE